jgi:hypothetical protein
MSRAGLLLLPAKRGEGGAERRVRVFSAEERPLTPDLSPLPRGEGVTFLE